MELKKKSYSKFSQKEWKMMCSEIYHTSRALMPDFSNQCHLHVEDTQWTMTGHLTRLTTYIHNCTDDIDIRKSIN